LAHSREYGPKVAALVREPVVITRRVLRVRNADQDAFVNESRQATLKDVARDAEAALEVLEPGDPQERVAHDQHAPPLPDHLEALRDRAVHAGEALAFHGHRIEGCIIKRNALGCVR
jgi:hypothetical protein